jgi:hypothetical protein
MSQKPPTSATIDRILPSPALLAAQDVILAADTPEQAAGHVIDDQDAAAQCQLVEQRRHHDHYLDRGLQDRSGAVNRPVHDLACQGDVVQHVDRVQSLARADGREALVGHLLVEGRARAEAQRVGLDSGAILAGSVAAGFRASRSPSALGT